MNAYAVEVRAAWSEFFRTLPAEARILDVGIGNHIPALIAADIASAQRRDWRIDAIDPVNAATQKGVADLHADVRRIVFHADAELARLPFEDASFDALCGHHTLEFADSADALMHFHRVLRPGGDAQFLLHHAESPILGSARISLREADLIFTKTKAFRRVHHLVTMTQVTPVATQRADDEVRLSIRTLKRALQIAQQHGGGRVLTVALDAMRTLLSARREMKPDAAGLVVDRAEEELRASVRRLGELVSHARTEADMRQLERVAASAGFSQIERLPLRGGDGDVFAWQLLLHRA